jgi:RNA polymerase sigma factor (sigma-70 family)
MRCRVPGLSVDDCIQEAWTELVQMLPAFVHDASRGPFEAWLRTVVRRTACRYARRLLREIRQRTEAAPSEPICGRFVDPRAAHEQTELGESVREALEAFRAEVSSSAYAVLILATIDSRPSSEIARRLSLTPGNVRVLHHRTTQKLRRFLARRAISLECWETLGIPPDSV